jgi:hypothetical protein
MDEKDFHSELEPDAVASLGRDDGGFPIHNTIAI